MFGTIYACGDVHSNFRRRRVKCAWFASAPIATITDTPTQWVILPIDRLKLLHWLDKERYATAFCQVA
jgi:hypothetical protein